MRSLPRVQWRIRSGKTTASRLKSLYLFIQKTHGPAAADAFLLSTRLDREYLEDETRLVPVEVWHNALVMFASRYGREAIENSAPAVVHPENLGVWTHVLRGASDALTVYRRLDQFGGEHGSTERWRTLDAAPGVWHGAIRLGSESSTDSDGLSALARKAELAAIPLMFGLPVAEVVAREADLGAGAGRVQDFEVRWGEPSLRQPLTLGALLGALSAWGLGAVWDAHSVLAVFGGTAAGALLGAAFTHEWRRRVQTVAQLTRIHVLERAATLREARDRSQVGFQEGLVVAGQYRLSEKLGAGANGTIWEAERLADGELVAIKLLRAAVAHDTVAADRLRREAAALGLAWHPNVVEIFDEGHLPDGTSYLVMERLHGESLGARLRRSGPLSPEELLPIALQVCDALGAVHAAGIVHRDLKPSNIFLVAPTQGSPERAKILDFGIARVEWAETRLTNTDVPLGTPGYMPPEQEQGLEVDARSDIYAVGAALFECLSGATPQAHGRDPRPALGPLGVLAESGVQPTFRQIPAQWGALIARAMAREPRERFPDTRALKEALLATDEGQKVSA